ncbi:pilus protein [Enterococcus florum]|uniref:Pilus protein n=1 Tax=Enterococcus florum TaxID=2480627 RepID=A0A4P5P8L7_9ENTE|nr:SpaH/EbpB family LPXTG-anchored major pilin [Enterococcus florum]GCF94385.1 pilus protein [Enterococcus florum]
MKKKTKVVRWVTAMICLIPLLAGVFHSGAAASAAEETVKVTLHKKKMDEFPTKPIQNTGELMPGMDQYEGLPGVKFTAWDITADFYKELDEQLDGSETKAEYKEKIQQLMKDYVFSDMRAAKAGDAITDDAGDAVFKSLVKRAADGTYKVYYFEEEMPTGATAHANPTILVLPMMSGENELNEVHLYPKNKIAGEVGKELLDEDGDALPDAPDDYYGYEVGKLINYRATFTMPNQIGEIIEKDGKNQTRYARLILKDELNKTGVKFEGIFKIAIGGTDLTDAQKSAFLANFVEEYKNTDSPYAGNAGFTLTAKLNAENATDNAEEFNKSKQTAEFLSQYKGKKVEIYYGVSMTEHTPVDVEIDNDFAVQLTQDDQSEEWTIDPTEQPPSIGVGGHKFHKHEDGKETQGLGGAEFVVIKQADSKTYYMTLDAVKNVGWTEYTTREDMMKNAAKIVSANDGKVVVSGLAAGSYALREVKAPNGFQLLEEDVDFVIQSGSYDDETALNIPNVSQGGFLPSTGGMGILAFIIVGSALMLGAVINYRRTQDHAI